MARDWRAVRKHQLMSSTPLPTVSAREMENNMPGPNDPNTDPVLDAAETPIVDADLQPEVQAEGQQPEAQAAPEVPAKPEVQPKVRQLTPRELANLRRTERLVGRETANAQLLQKAQSLGYDTIEEMLSAAPKKAPAPGAQEAAPAQEPTGRGSAKLKELETTNRSLENKLRRESEARRALEKSIELARVAREQGIKDDDYALHLLRKRVQGMQPNDAAKLDPAKFFAGLKTTHSYLFGSEGPKVETTRPTTSPAAKPAPSAPTAAAVATDTASADQVDVSKLSQREYDEYLRQKGIKNPRYLS